MIDCRPNKTTPEEKLEIVNLYQNNVSIPELGKKFGISRQSVYWLLRRREVVIRPQTVCQRKYSLDETFFDKIDSEEKAYFLGFLYADGSNYEKRNEITLTLQERDKHILDTFSGFINNGRSLYYYVGKGNRVNYYRLSINSKHMSQRLAELGCMQRKTFKLEFPDFLREDLIHHFIRGYFDGDGTVGICSKPAPSGGIYVGAWFRIVGTRKFCEGIRFVSEKVLGISGSLIINHPEDNDIITCFSLSGKKQILKFLGWLYKDATVYLTRKHDKYLELAAQYAK